MKKTKQSPIIEPTVVEPLSLSADFLREAENLKQRLAGNELTQDEYIQRITNLAVCQIERAHRPVNFEHVNNPKPGERSAWKLFTDGLNEFVGTIFPGVFTTLLVVALVKLWLDMQAIHNGAPVPDDVTLDIEPIDIAA